VFCLFVTSGLVRRNRSEYIAVISTIVVFAAGVFYALYFKTAQSAPPKKLKSK
jgi:Sec-independent protein secretion pathway component TatC